MSFEARLAELKIELPPAPKPVASYVPAVRADDLLFLSGTGPFKDGKIVYAGKLGKDLTVEQGYEAAKLTLLNALAIVKQELGSLNQIKRVVRMSGHVASAEGFTQQPQVLNGASDLLVEIFGEAGRHARLALGAAELPLNMAIELELILQAPSPRAATWAAGASTAGLFHGQGPLFTRQDPVSRRVDSPKPRLL